MCDTNRLQSKLFEINSGSVVHSAKGSLPSPLKLVPNSRKWQIGFGNGEGDTETQFLQLAVAGAHLCLLEEGNRV